MAELDHFWDASFPSCPPVSYWLREAFPDRWVRFHSLPESKRYAENEQEYQTILYRHNIVLNALVGQSREVVLLTTAHSETEQGAERHHCLSELDPAAEPWRIVPMHDEDDSDRNYWHLFASRWAWRSGVFDRLFRLIADDEVGNVMLAYLDAGCVYHPYDGGADVILRDTRARDELRKAHPEWLSRHPSGL